MQAHWSTILRKVKKRRASQRAIGPSETEPQRTREPLGTHTPRAHSHTAVQACNGPHTRYAADLDTGGRPTTHSSSSLRRQNEVGHVILGLLAVMSLANQDSC